LSGDGERLAILASVTRTVTTRDDKVRIGGAGREVKEEKTTREIRVYETTTRGQPLTYPDPTPGGRLAAVTGDGRRMVEGEPRDWRVVQTFPAEDVFPLRGPEYEEVLLSPDDRYLACRSERGQVLVLEARAGKRLFQTPELGARLVMRFVPG